MATGAIDCRRTLVGLALLTVGLAVVFRFLPWIDLAVSGWFHDAATGFTFTDVPGWEAVLQLNKAASILFVCSALVMLAVGLSRRRADNRLWVRYWGFAILVYLLGPGLLVNGLLKRSFGRARPAQIEAFGGDGPFTAAWQFSDYCQSACSFVSAETSVAAALTVALAVGALWFASRPAGRWFRTLAWAAFGLLLLIALQRIGSGRHFLSDVIFATLPVTMIGMALACYLRPPGADPDATRPIGRTP